jgi:hypothetical protein
MKFYSYASTNRSKHRFIFYFPCSNFESRVINDWDWFLLQMKKINGLVYYLKAA